MSNERPRPLLLGHRGASFMHSLRENTIASFDRAMADGCDGFEFDVRRSADGQAVLCHNPESRGKFIEMSTADELPHLDRLPEVLERYQDAAFLDIELKVFGLEKIVSDLLRRFRPRKGYVVSSFLPGALSVLHDEDPSIPLGLICEHKAGLSQARNLAIDYVIASEELLSQGVITEIKNAAKKSFVWTVNDAAGMKRFHQMGVDGIISDNTQLLCEVFKR
jgi:glycerophosphoryl diester phosphodiesterase